MNKMLLLMSLEAAVPLWIEDAKRLPWKRVQERAAECAQTIGEKGDVLQFGGGKKGEAARAFNALAEGLAYLSFSPGGVKFMGRHWESKHPESK